MAAARETLWWPVLCDVFLSGAGFGMSARGGVISADNGPGRAIRRMSAGNGIKTAGALYRGDNDALWYCGSIGAGAGSVGLTINIAQGRGARILACREMVRPSSASGASALLRRCCEKKIDSPMSLNGSRARKIHVNQCTPRHGGG